MILESLKALSTPATSQAKRLGLVYEAVAIEARAKRCRMAWRPHLQASKKEINASLETMKEQGHVVVLGSGCLNDIDIEPLIKKARQIDLIDIVQTHKARRVARNHNKIRLIEADVTGLADDFLRCSDHQKGPMPSPSPSFEFMDASPNLTVSLNLLSQLALPFLRHKQSQPLSDEEASNFEEYLMRNHIESLRALPGQKLLITDIQRRYHTSKNVEVDDVLPASLGLPAPRSTWIWTVAPKGETKPWEKIEHQVGAFDLNEEGS